MTEIEMIIKMMEMQKVLDDAIYSAKGIEYDSKKCMRAIIDEVGELNHELKPSWCWWKETVGEVDNKKVLGELVDIWHFVLSAWNHNDFCDGLVSPETCLIEFFDNSKSALNDKKIIACDIHVKISTCFQYIISTDLEKMISGLLMISEFLGFSMYDVYMSYKEKNVENFDRLNSGY